MISDLIFYVDRLELMRHNNAMKASCPMEIQGTPSGVVNRLFGEKLRGIRRQMNYSQSELANLVKLSRVSIANIESGSQNVQLHHVYCFAQALNVPLEKLLPTRSELDFARSPLVGVRSDLMDSSDLLFLNIAKSRLRALAGDDR